MAKQGFMNSNNLGIMQGRLVNSPNKKIQCFPAKEWKKEFGLANRNNFRLIEWTVNRHNLYLNPLLHLNKLKEIQKENFYPKNILLLESANGIGLAISKILQQTNPNTGTDSLIDLC